MRLSPAVQYKLLFGFLCLVWGTTFLAMKAGISVVPPSFFSGMRWTAAGLILLGWRWTRGAPLRVPPRLWGRLVVVALLMVSLNASIQLYGLRWIGSGLASVLTSGVTPVALLGFGILSGQERFSGRQAAAIGLGLVGLLILFGPSAWNGERGGAEALGSSLVLVGCLFYCAGSVAIRPVLRTLSPAHVAMVTNLVGGVALLVGSLLFEPGAVEAARLHWGAAAWAGWWFLLLPGSLGASIVYFLLVRDWGASRTGTYAFISPVIAVLLGMAVYGESLRALDAVGMALMLAAAGFALRRDPAAASERSPARVGG